MTRLETKQKPTFSNLLAAAVTHLVYSLSFCTNWDYTTHTHTHTRSHSMHTCRHTMNVMNMSPINEYLHDTHTHTHTINLIVS